MGARREGFVSQPGLARPEAQRDSGRAEGGQPASLALHRIQQKPRQGSSCTHLILLVLLVPTDNRAKRALSLGAGACVRAKSLQPCPTLCDPMDCGPPGSPVHGMLQARRLEWVAIPFSRGSSRPRDRTESLHLPGWQTGSLLLVRLLKELPRPVDISPWIWQNTG